MAAGSWYPLDVGRRAVRAAARYRKPDGDIRRPACARGRWLDPGRAADPPRASAGALGDQTFMRRPRVCSVSIFSSTPTHALRVLDPDIWVARAIANVLIIPFLPCSDCAQHRLVDRNARSRGAVSTPRRFFCPASFCSRSPAPDTLSATLAAIGARASDRTLVRGVARGRADGVVGQFSVQAKGLRQQAFFLIPLRLPRRVAAVHSDARRGKFPARLAGIRDPGARQPGRKPGRRALAAT